MKAPGKIHVTVWLFGLAGAALFTGLLVRQGIGQVWDAFATASRPNGKDKFRRSNSSRGSSPLFCVNCFLICPASRHLPFSRSHHFTPGRYLALPISHARSRHAGPNRPVSLRKASWRDQV